MECIDLKERFGKRYRTFWEGDEVVLGAERAWSRELRGKHGTIHPLGGTRLAAEVTSNQIANRLMREGHTPFVELDEGAVFHFDVANYKPFFKALRLRTKKNLTPEQRQAIADRLSKARAARGAA